MRLRFNLRKLRSKVALSISRFFFIQDKIVVLLDLLADDTIDGALTLALGLPETDHCLTANAVEVVVVTRLGC